MMMASFICFWLLLGTVTSVIYDLMTYDDRARKWEKEHRGL